MGSVWFIAEMKWLYPPIVAGRFDGKDERTWNSSHLNGHFNEDNDENTLLLLAFEWQSQWISLLTHPFLGSWGFTGWWRVLQYFHFLPIWHKIYHDLYMCIIYIYMSYVCFSTTLLYYLGLLLSDHWGSWLHDSYVHPQMTTYWQWWLHCFGAYVQFKLKPCQTQKKSENIDKTPQFCR